MLSKDATKKVTGHSPRQLAWRRFKTNKVAIPALVAVIFIIGVVVFAPQVCDLLGISPDERDEASIDSRGQVVGEWGGISAKHPLGVVPGIGYDVLARLLYGARISFLIALMATLASVGMGMLLGMLSGYFRGRVDGVIGRFTDFLLAFPSFFMILALSAPLVQRIEMAGIARDNDARILYLILILGVFGWPYLSRIIRSQVLSLRERDFVLSARALGASNSRIIFREILPNVWTPVIVYMSLSLPGYLTAEAVFSYLGIGVQPPTPTWGLLIADSTKFIINEPTYFFIPSLALILVVLVFNLLGDALRDALDPKSET
jgi:peptide/nickel transport system permease protein